LKENSEALTWLKEKYAISEETIDDQEVPSLSMTIRHGTRLPGRNHARLNKLNQLQDITAHTTTETIPSLFIQHHMQ
jgi:hypothetical protein